MAVCCGSLYSALSEFEKWREYMKVLHDYCKVLQSVFKYKNSFIKIILYLENRKSEEESCL